jgi:hypothetical protein
MNIRQLYELSEEQFVKRSSLMMLWQEIAENFYPERAEFTINRSMGTDFGAGMMTSYPFICRRDLGDQLGQMLRSNDWFELALLDAITETTDVKQALQWAAALQRRAMYDRVSAVHARGEAGRSRLRHLRPVRAVGGDELPRHGAPLQELPPARRDLGRQRHRRGRRGVPQVEAASARPHAALPEHRAPAGREIARRSRSRRSSAGTWSSRPICTTATRSDLMRRSA